MSYKDNYYDDVDAAFNKLKGDPFNRPIQDPIPHQDDREIHPTAWVENADADDGDATVVIDADGITISNGKLQVTGPNGETMIEDGQVKTDGIHADAVIANVANVGGSVIIDSDGITVIDGAITVESPDGTVIIDGSSNMFKILATGTVQNTVADNTDNDVALTTLSSLGTFSATPAHMSFLTTGTAVTANRSGSHSTAPASDFVASTSGGAVNQNRIMATVDARIATILNGSDEVQISFRMYAAGVGGSTTWHARYYILQEVAF